MRHASFLTNISEMALGLRRRCRVMYGALWSLIASAVVLVLVSCPKAYADTYCMVITYYASYSPTPATVCKYSSKEACIADASNADKGFIQKTECKLGSGEGSASSAPTDPTGMMVHGASQAMAGAITNNPTDIGTGMGQAAAGLILQGILGDPQADAQRQAAEAAQKAAAEQQRQEVLRKQEEAKQRMLGELKGAGTSGDLQFKTGSEADVAVTTTRSAFGTHAVVPVNPNTSAAPVLDGMQLKTSDAPAVSGSGFDTSGALLGAKLPPPPPTPPASPASAPPQVVVAKMNNLKTLLKKDQQEKAALDTKLQQLQQSPTPDQSAIADVQQQIANKSHDVQKVQTQLQDLTAADPDAPPSAASGAPVPQ